MNGDRMKKWNRTTTIVYLLVLVSLITIYGVVQAASGYIGSTDKWAWGTNVGWINFAPAQGGVSVYDDHLEGYIWGENIGWVRLGTYEGGGSHTYTNDSANTYGINNDGNGNLSGYAWGTNVGWINFNPTLGGVTIDPDTGEFDGYAWGENIGWIHFKSTGDVAYKVALTSSLVIPSDGIRSDGVIISNDGTMEGPITSITVQFSRDANDPVGHDDPDDVTNPDNYMLIQPGEDGDYDTLGCAAPGFHADDFLIPVGPVSYDNTGGNGQFNAEVTVNNGEKLPDGEYRFFICGSTSIVDENLVALAGDGVTSGTDSVLDFTVQAPAASHDLPATGFPPGIVTDLPDDHSRASFTSTVLELEIPTLNVRSHIVGVPLIEKGWNLTWLGNQVGWLHGTAFPSWEGNSVVTAHVVDANGQPGLFNDLNRLEWGDEVIVHAYGQEYVYAVRTIEEFVDPQDTADVFQHEDYPWLTLITCKGYDQESASYRWRVVVRAVQVRID